MEPAQRVKLSSLLINGAAHVELIETEIGVFGVRPLTNGERAQVKARRGMGLKQKTRVDPVTGQPSGAIDMEIDLEKSELADEEAKFLALAFGLSVEGESYSVRDIKRWTAPEGVLDTLYERICEISGMASSPQEQLKELFRDGGGGATGEPGGGGESAGADNTGDDAAAG